MVQLMQLMLFCLIVTIPLMSLFAKCSALEGQPGYMTNRFSLGNMGGSRTHCTQVLYASKPDAKLNLQCGTGSVFNLDSLDDKTGTDLFEVGIINQSQGIPFYCTNSAFTDPYNCSSFINQDALKEDMRDKC